MTAPLHLSIDASALPAQEQALLLALLDMLLSGGQDVLAQYVQVLQCWEQAPLPRRAIALKLMDHQIRSNRVALICGISDRQLRRYPEYQRFARLLDARRDGVPRGQQSEDGGMEAWES
jgi:hypothetical protein